MAKVKKKVKKAHKKVPSPAPKAASAPPTPERQRSSLTITDNRTGQSYEIGIIEDAAIRASDLRQIRVKPDDFGLMSYDPAFTNTASCKSRVTYIDGDRGIREYRGYPIEQLAEKST